MCVYIGLHVKYPLFLSDFNGTLFFSIIIKYQISWKSVQWEPSCSMWADRHDKANNRFLQFCERAEKWWVKGTTGLLVLHLKRTYSLLTWYVSLFYNYCLEFFFVAQQPSLGLGRLNVDVLILHTDAPRSVGLLWKRELPFVETCTLLHIMLILFS